MAHEQTTQTPASLDAIAQKAVARYQLPGLAIAIAKRDEEIFAAGYGHCDAAATQPVNPDTLFGVASVTKFLTAISILHLRDKGQLSLDTPVNHYYPSLQAAADNTIQLQHLLRHAAGWRGLDSRFHALDRASPESVLQNRRELESVEDLVEHMNQAKDVTVTPPDEQLNYSNEGFCLLGGIVQQITGRPWHQYIEQNFFTRAALCNSTFGIPAPARYTHVACPLIRDNGHYRSAGFWDAPLFYPAGGLVTSCRDLLQLLSFVDHSDSLLSADSKTWLHNPAITIASRHRSRFGYSAGFEYRKFESGLSTHWHTGQRAGISSFVATTPSNGLRIAVLCNVADAPLTALAFELLSHLEPGYCPNWPPVESKPQPPPDGTSITGNYHSDEGFHFAVTCANGKYYLTNLNSNTTNEMVFQTARRGYVGHSTFAFLPFTNDTFTLALDLRLIQRH